MTNEDRFSVSFGGMRTHKLNPDGTTGACTFDTSGFQYPNCSAETMLKIQRHMWHFVDAMIKEGEQAVAAAKGK